MLSRATRSSTFPSAFFFPWSLTTADPALTAPPTPTGMIRPFADSTIVDIILSFNSSPSA